MSNRGKNREDHLPTPDEIRAYCLELQKTWTEREEMLRRGLRPENYRVPQVREPWTNFQE